jgi:hypothetical protein
MGLFDNLFDGFNPQAFAAGALGEVERGMTRREEEARKYEEEQRELAKQSRAEIQRRRSVVGSLVSEARRLESLGVTKAQIQAAHSSGPNGLMELSKQVQAEIKRRGGKARLSEYDISAMIDGSAIDPKFAEMDYEEFISRSAGLLDTTVGDLKAPERSLAQRFLGSGAKDAVRAKLDAEKTVGGMSVYDINELARSQAYQSAIPGAYATFTPGEFYDQEAALKSWSLAQKRIDTAVEKDPIYLELKAGPDGEAAALEYKRKKYAAFAQAQFNKYGADAINDPVVNWKDILGEEMYTELAIANEADEGIISAIDAGASEIIGTNTTKSFAGGSYTLSTGLGDTVARIKVVGEKGEKTIDDPQQISDFLDILVARGEMTQEAANKLKPVTTGATVPEIEVEGLGRAGELDISAITEAALGAVEEEEEQKATVEAEEPEVTEAPDVESISAPTAEEFKVNGVTFEEWQGMSRKERKDAGLPEGEVAGQIKFKRFQKGLGVNIASDQSAASFEDMGKAQMGISGIDVDTVVTIGGEEYRVQEALGDKYFEKVDGGIPEAKSKEITEQAVKTFLETLKNKEYSTNPDRDVDAAFAQFIFDNDLPDETIKYIEDRLDQVKAALADK